MFKESNLPDCPFQIYEDNAIWISLPATDFLVELIKKNKQITSLDLVNKYGISDNSARRIIYLAYSKQKHYNAMPVKRFGFRDDTYFTEDYLLNGVSYEAEELEGEEKELLNIELPKKDKIKRWI